MSDFPRSEALANLDARQDELLSQLDALNQRIEQTLAELVPGNDPQAHVAPQDASPEQVTVAGPDGPTC
jgi:hypothetical protein